MEWHFIMKDKVSFVSIKVNCYCILHLYKPHISLHSTWNIRKFVQCIPLNTFVCTFAQHKIAVPPFLFFFFLSILMVDLLEVDQPVFKLVLFTHPEYHSVLLLWLVWQIWDKLPLTISISENRFSRLMNTSGKSYYWPNNTNH